MKVNVEGIRSLIYYVGYLTDLKAVSGDQAERERLQGIIDVLIPVAKGYVTDKSFEVCSHGVQVYGGYGFIEEYPQAQLMRDARITMIYEGTNGIQAMDFLGRKLGMNKGKPLMVLLTDIRKTIDQARKHDMLNRLACDLEKVLDLLGVVAVHMGQKAMSAEVMHDFAFAHPFLEACGDVVMGWMLLWRALIASEKVDSAKKDQMFYVGQIKSAAFFIENMLPVTLGKMNALLKTSHAAMDMPEQAFIS